MLSMILISFELSVKALFLTKALPRLLTMLLILLFIDTISRLNVSFNLHEMIAWSTNLVGMVILRVFYVEYVDFDHVFTFPFEHKLYVTLRCWI